MGAEVVTTGSTSGWTATGPFSGGSHAGEDSLRVNRGGAADGTHLFKPRQASGSGSVLARWGVVMPRLATSPSLRPALRRIAEFASLPADWDAEGADPLAARAVAEACLLIEAVAERQEQRTGIRQAPWTSSPLPDGGVQVEWLGRSARVDVEIAPDGTFAYMVKRGSGANAEYEEAPEVERNALLDVIARALAS